MDVGAAGVLSEDGQRDAMIGQGEEAGNGQRAKPHRNRRLR
jgi:hypothetical protein